MWSRIRSCKNEHSHAQASPWPSVQRCWPCGAWHFPVPRSVWTQRPPCDHAWVALGWHAMLASATLSFMNHHTITSSWRTHTATVLFIITHGTDTHESCWRDVPRFRASLPDVHGCPHRPESKTSQLTPLPRLALQRLLLQDKANIYIYIYILFYFYILKISGEGGGGAWDRG